LRPDDKRNIERNAEVDNQENSGYEDNVPRDWYPFDPYALPRSKGFVSDNFMEYAAPDDHDEIVTDGDDTDLSDEMDEDDM
jgi:hypothetical protein